MPIKRVQEAIEEIKKGNIIVMVDDEDRENEGDLIYAATFSSPEKVNFLIKEGRGLICVAISNKIAKRLELSPMVKENSSAFETAFTVSVDSKDVSTGISAFERDRTIKLLASSLSSKDDFVKPGHIFPIVAKEGGVLVRTGHTEGSVDLCRLAGLREVAVICEIIKDDGTMARRKDLESFAKKFKLKMVYISDIVEYRLRNELLIDKIRDEKIDFFGYKTLKKDFLDHQNNIHTAIIFGKIAKKTNVKFHNVVLDKELFLNQSQYESLIKSINFLGKEGGVLVFIYNRSKVFDRTKEFGIGAQILKSLGIEEIKLLTPKKGREFIGLSGFGLNITEEIEL